MHDPLADTENTQSLSISSMLLYPTDRRKVIQIIKALKNKVTAGIDNISDKLLKTCKEITAPLVFNINQSFKEGVVPAYSKIISEI